MRAYMRTFLGVFAITLFLAGSAFASVEAFNLKPTVAGLRAAEGQVIVTDAEYEQREIALEARGLEPNSVYTVWFTSSQPGKQTSGVGVGDYSFKTNASGYGRHVVTMSESRIRGWDNIEIAFHPDGNPKNMTNATIALRTRIR